MSNQSRVESTLGSGFGVPAYLLWGREYWQRMNLLEEGMRMVDTSIYCFGFLANVPILWIFFKEGFASTSNINFFSLGGADLCVCFIYIVNYLFRWILRHSFLCRRYSSCNEMFTIWDVYLFPNQEALKSFSAWITAVITLERLLCITFPMKVSSPSWAL